MRIVSLLPSATEMICEIGLSEHLVGVSHECDYPTRVTSLPKVTQSRIPPNATSAEIDTIVTKQSQQGDLSLYTLDEPLLQTLCPDVIVTQTLCSVCAVSESEIHAISEKFSTPPLLINLSPTSLSEVIAGHLTLGRALGHEAKALEAVKRLQQRVDVVTRRSLAIRPNPSVVLLEWLDPPFSAGHWNPQLIRMAGGVEAIGEENAKSRRIDWSQLMNADPEVLLVACCGYGVERSVQDVAKLVEIDGFKSLQAYREHRIYIADGSSYFNRPGPRLVDSLELLAHAIDPKVHAMPSNLIPMVRWDHTFER